MKITGARVESFLRAPDPVTRAILLFGPDEGLVRERAQRLAKHALEDLNDPFRMVDIAGVDLKDDPARLSDEALSLSFGGGRRVVWVRQAGDSCVQACRVFLDQSTPCDSMVIITAADLNPRSKLRKLFDASKVAASIACYADDARSLPDVIRESLNRHNLSVDRAALMLLVQSLGSDRSVTRGELDKLALYMGEETQVTDVHVRACIGDSAATRVEEVINAAAGGDPATLENTLSRALADGVNPIQIVRAAQRHFQRLHLARGHMDDGLNADQATKALKPPVFYMQVDAFRSQLGLWSPDKLARAFEVLTQAETDCKTTGLPAPAIAGRALLTLTQAAKAGRRHK